MQRKHRGRGEELQALEAFFNGGYCAPCADVELVNSSKDKRLLAFLILGFLQRSSRKEYIAFKGDLTSSLIVAEIWLYNIGRLYARNRHLLDEQPCNCEEISDLIPGCNAYSIALSLGLPPETVRRKVKNLITEGWVRKTAEGDLIATSQMRQFFGKDSQSDLISDFLSTARHFIALIDDGTKTDNHNNKSI